MLSWRGYGTTGADMDRSPRLPENPPPPRGGKQGAPPSQGGMKKDDVERLKEEGGKCTPDYGAHFMQYSEQLDPEAGIEKEYPMTNNKVYVWQALRLARRYDLESFARMKATHSFDSLVPKYLLPEGRRKDLEEEEETAQRQRFIPKLAPGLAPSQGAQSTGASGAAESRAGGRGGELDDDMAEVEEDEGGEKSGGGGGEKEGAEDGELVGSWRKGSTSRNPP